MAKPRVAIIGLGAAGLVALKNLREEGLDAVGFERNAYIGGLWKFSDDARTSVLPTTTVNISKQRGCFTDFPFSDDVGTYPSAGEVHDYLVSYASHFNLGPYIHLNMTVLSVHRDENNGQWRIEITSGAGNPTIMLFDRLIVANGTNAIPHLPSIQHEECFKGQIIHAAAFKRPRVFQGQKVLVVGIGNTAADTATALRGLADKVYLSYRTGSIVMPRILDDGSALDHGLSYRKMGIQYTLERFVPAVAESVGLRFATSIQDKAFKLQPEWRLSPAPPLIRHVPVISDTLIDGLASGEIVSVAGLERILDPSTVQLEDSSTLEIDAIIFATGYNQDYRFLGEYDPTASGVPCSSADPHRREGGRLPDRQTKVAPVLYQNIFSLEHPDSLAFVGAALFPSPAFQVYDLTSMAIAQLWSARPDTAKLPSRQEMVKSVDSHILWVKKMSAGGSFNPRWVRAPEWMAWVEEVLGLNVSTNLSFFRPAAWRFWYRDPTFYKMLMDGIFSPHIYRLFDSQGRRKEWEGAEEAIRQVNSKTTGCNKPKLS